MRMHPCDARVPIDHGSDVPWMPTPPTIPSQRALSGLRGSHGCIRMRVGDVIDLYDRVPVGTPVLIR
jgi:lipoprotein-anchoring transpeptidase ErfK/SrfK